jgi:hypothetical protein
MITLNIIGNFQDSLNVDSGSYRKFAFNRGELDAKRDLWNIDLIEIIGANYLADSEGNLILTETDDKIII